MKYLILSSLLLISCTKTKEVDPSLHIGECFKFGEFSYILVESLAEENGQSHDINVIYYSPTDHGIMYQRNTDKYSSLSKSKERTLCPKEFLMFRKRHQY